MGSPTAQFIQKHQMMNLVTTIILAWLSLCSAQQMCVYQDSWSEPKSIVTFNSHSTLHTSTVEDSLVNVSNASTTGEIRIGPDLIIRPIGRSVKFHLQLSVGFHLPDKPYNSPKAEVFLQKDGKVTLIDSYSINDGYGSSVSKQSIVGFADARKNDMNPKKLGYLLLDENHLIREFHETGYLAPGQTLRLVTGAITGEYGCYLDITMCILYDGYEKGY